MDACCHLINPNDFRYLTSYLCVFSCSLSFLCELAPCRLHGYGQTDVHKMTDLLAICRWSSGSLYSVAPAATVMQLSVTGQEV